MLDHAEIARILDIMGNRNRRRIIELLRQKPCFVTEISDRLVLSPKAVIEHLQLMEREQILTFRLDERRRKYYSLARDITIDVSLNWLDQGQNLKPDRMGELRQALFILRKMVTAREEITESLRNIEQNIDGQIREIVRQGSEILGQDGEIDLLIALAHSDLSARELMELTGVPEDELWPGLEDLKEKRIVEREGKTFRLCGAHAR
ncbi:MAG: ArsR family transcriptional regulator [Methanoregulaceae archaeon]|jgi:ArsR family transcriptional regulator|nr:ArsR family transcriptional regulator [Methanoregulaceae archaeon]